ncbi:MULTISPECIES: hypothetical protein [Photorhabdus]|uniref:Uncharacterized protein n=1 Tax=Photorhabdus thracensis TaxID=230089 RepID=A0A0F7LLD2_9GAMM|nr:hypothetical protein [Photorhabdus thracensis]AKH62803.1 hypothetical protein VY86_05070 [Photorhabdus thracensis]MCC8422904.1 hypothetical protein [Photorhabdus thracensis]
MLKDNEVIMLPGTDAINILSEVEYILISLRNIARYYYDETDGHISNERKAEYCSETTRFIDEKEITYRLAKIRAIMSEKFNNGIGEDDMDDIEREMEKIKYWIKPGD